MTPELTNHHFQHGSFALGALKKIGLREKKALQAGCLQTIGRDEVAIRRQPQHLLFRSQPSFLKRFRQLMERRTFRKSDAFDDRLTGYDLVEDLAGGGQRQQGIIAGLEFVVHLPKPAEDLEFVPIPNDSLPEEKLGDFCRFHARRNFHLLDSQAGTAGRFEKQPELEGNHPHKPSHEGQQ